MSESTEPRPLVIDASAAVEFLAVAGETGRWVARVIAETKLHAPDLFRYEVLSALRRHNLAGRLSDRAGRNAVETLLELSVELHPSSALTARCWELRRSLSVYDAAYVALAESLRAPLLTLDARLTRAPGPRCEFLVYEPA